MAKKNSRKNSTISILLLVFFVLGMMLIMVDLANNISSEIANGQGSIYGYIEPGSAVETSPQATPRPTPTIDPILTDFNQ